MSAQEWATQAANKILNRCDQLSKLTSMEGGIERDYLSPQMAKAYELTAGWLNEVGIATHIDQAGNLVGRLEGKEPGLPALVLGSHLDSVPDAGKYDGILGVVTAVSATRKARGSVPRCSVHMHSAEAGATNGLALPTVTVSPCAKHSLISDSIQTKSGKPLENVRIISAISNSISSRGQSWSSVIERSPRSHPSPPPADTWSR